MSSNQENLSAAANMAILLDDDDPTQEQQDDNHDDEEFDQERSLAQWNASLAHLGLQVAADLALDDDDEDEDYPGLPMLIVRNSASEDQHEEEEEGQEQEQEEAEPANAAANAAANAPEQDSNASIRYKGQCYHPPNIVLCQHAPTVHETVMETAHFEEFLEESSAMHQRKLHTFSGIVGNVVAHLTANVSYDPRSLDTRHPKVVYGLVQERTSPDSPVLVKVGKTLKWKDRMESLPRHTFAKDHEGCFLARGKRL